MVVLMGFVPRKRFRWDGMGCRVGMVGQALDNDGFGDAVSGGCCERRAVTRDGDTDE